MKKISLTLSLLILLLLICNPVLAINESVDIVDTGYDYNLGVGYNGPLGSYSSAGYRADTIFLRNAEYLYDLNALFYRSVAGAGFTTFPENPQSFTVNYQIGENIVGSGRYGTYQENRGGQRYNVVWLSFEDLDLSGYSGLQAVKIVNTDTQGVFPKIYYICKNPGVFDWGTWNSTYHRVYLGHQETSSNYLTVLWHYAEVYYSTDFKNSYTISETINGWHDFYLHRQIDGKTYPSMLYLTVGDNIITAGSTAGTSDILIENIQGTPITVSIKSTSGNWYNETFDDGATGPDDPDESGITVYVKNSQTGALIADANIVIDALVDGEYYPVTNRTEPSGIFSINLQPTGGGKPNPDGYRLIVTADGYNNPMPEINFTLGDYRKYFECFLDPIAGGPVNENKTFIDFFVRDMSSNPISGATVKFGKYTLITNSQGYTVFEVDKNNNYSWTVSKSGYGALTGNAVIGDSPRHTINTVLAPIVTPTTTTPIPTSPSIGPTPTMTAPTGEHVSNWLEWFAAHFGMILGGGVEIGKIFMWLCFTVPVGVYVGKEAKAGAAGFMAGAGIVTLFFVLIGWVPIWLVVLLALIIGLLYAKVFNAQDNGGGR
jgi:hypothetical protein